MWRIREESAKVFDAFKLCLLTHSNSVWTLHSYRQTTTQPGFDDSDDHKWICNDQMTENGHHNKGWGHLPTTQASSGSWWYAWSYECEVVKIGYDDDNINKLGLTSQRPKHHQEVESSSNCEQTGIELLHSPEIRDQFQSDLLEKNFSNIVSIDVSAASAILVWDDWKTKQE